MKSQNILIPINPNTFGYNIYKELIKPYLDVFGMPYDEVPASLLCEKLRDGASLVLLAQPDVKLSEESYKSITEAVKDGCGLFAAQSSLLERTEFKDFVSFSKQPELCSGEEIILENNHYITRYHTKGEKIKLYSSLYFYRNSCLKNAAVIASVSQNPLLEISQFGKGRIVLFNTASWISTEILGQLHGMDDIFRESIIWAAQKPFVMKGMPAFVGMRVDDVWGSWRNILPENPLLWMEIANQYNLKPWLGVFQDNIDERSTEIIKKFVDSGRATAFPHAFAGCRWTTSELPEDWIWYDHLRARPWSAEVMAQRAARAKDWFDKNQIQISKVAIPHYYETSEAALPILLEWGCEFIAIQMPIDAFYMSGAKLKCGPYRSYAPRAAGDSRPVYYADYLSFPHNPQIDRKLFNCVTEIRDVCGYELAPTNNVEETIENGITQLRRAIVSGVPATVFTHESCWIQQVTPENWETEIAGITNGIADLSPEYDTLDNISRYVRASCNIKIDKAMLDECGNLKLEISGINDMDTKCYMFFDKDDSIVMEEHIIPRNYK